MIDTHCTCGRFAKPHCVSCGSFGVYARPSMATQTQLADKSIVKDMSYVCRRCGTEFFDSDRGSCKAPASNETGRGLPPIEKSISKINIPSAKVAEVAEQVRRIREKRLAEERKSRGELE